MTAAGDRTFVFVLSVGLLTFNSVSFVVPGYDIVYVPLNLAVAAAVLVAAQRHGLRSPHLGTERRYVGAGLRWGGAAAGITAVALAVAVAVPALQGLLEDERVAGIGLGVLGYRTLVRIPFGTVVLEEVAFRGVLLGAWARWRGTVAGVVGSSVVFGLWHIRPAFELLAENDLAVSLAARSLAVAGLVAFTAAGGALFCLLRIRSGSLVAPVVAHAAVNSLATVAAYLIRN